MTCAAELCRFVSWGRHSRRARKWRGMRTAGLLLLLAGWGLVLSALILLPAASSRTAFLLAGFAVELAGLVLAMRRPPPPAESSR
jgi:hypothetical protein